jgi:hypothetical protein
MKIKGINVILLKKVEKDKDPFGNLIFEDEKFKFKG